MLARCQLVLIIVNMDLQAQQVASGITRLTAEQVGLIPPHA